jgi:tRNA(His) guanylyltransferase
MTLGNRMKEYEACSKNFLTRRNPVIIRIDGKAFHSFTKGMQKPFDSVLSSSMIETCKFLCANVMNCKLAYTQSDEISLLLVDYERLETEGWFSNNVQKMVSVSASMATLAFNNAFNALGKDTYPTKQGVAMFDSRAFSVPKEDVCNYFIWRQRDATKNSISSIAQSMFSHKELQGKNGDQKQEMIFQKSGANWNNYPAYQKRGSCVVKEQYDLNGATRTRWIEDAETPIFSKDREYIERYVVVA